MTEGKANMSGKVQTKIIKGSIKPVGYVVTRERMETWFSRLMRTLSLKIR